MKKLLLVSISVFLFLQLSAQDIISLPKLGDTNETYQFRSAAAGGLDISASGLGVVWDLSQIDPDSILPGIILSYYIDPQEAPFIDLFGDTDFVLVNEEDGIKGYTYIRLEGNRLLIIGTYDEDEMMPAVFPQPILLSPLPINYLDEETQTVPFVVDFFDEPDTLEVTLNFIADGYGTLLLPNGLEIEDCIKFSNSTTFNTIFDVEDEDLGDIRVRIVGTFSTTQFLSNDYGVPVLDLTTQKIDLFFVVVEDIVEVPIQSLEFPSEVQFLWQGGTAVSNRIFEGELKIWPNPVQNTLYLSTSDRFSSEQVDILIFDSNGKMVFKQKSASLGDGLQIEMSLFPSGFYQLLLHNDGRFFTERIIKQ
jgi:hypothetical protein